MVFGATMLLIPVTVDFEATPLLIRVTADSEAIPLLVRAMGDFAETPLPIPAPADFAAMLRPVLVTADFRATLLPIRVTGDFATPLLPRLHLGNAWVIGKLRRVLPAPPTAALSVAWTAAQPPEFIAIMDFPASAPPAAALLRPTVAVVVEGSAVAAMAAVAVAAGVDRRQLWQE